jgi:hypothetical protein
MEESIRHARGTKLGQASWLKRAGLAALACIGLLGATESNAHAARWWRRANDVKVVVPGDGATYNGVTISAWALSTQVGPNGGQKVLKGHWFSNGNGENPYIEWSVDGDAQATSLPWQRANYWPGSGVGRVWAIAKGSSVWYRTTAGWFYMPTNRCEGGEAISLRHVVGDNSIAVGYNSNVYVIESSGSLRWWNGSCWFRMPTPPSPPTNVAVWQVGEINTQTNVWISTTSQKFYRWTGYAWTLISFGTGYGIGGSRAIGSDGTSVWSLNGSGTSFTIDSSWQSQGLGAVRNVGTADWVTRPDGGGYHFE